MIHIKLYEDFLDAHDELNTIKRYVDDNFDEEAWNKRQELHRKYKDIKYYITGDNNEYRMTFYIKGIKIGYIEYYYYGNSISPNVDENEKELYLDYIEVSEKYRGNDYSSFMLSKIKEEAKKMGATIITLKADNGLGFGKRIDNKLVDLYKKNGFVFSFTEEECEKDDECNLGAMEYKIK